MLFDSFENVKNPNIFFNSENKDVSIISKLVGMISCLDKDMLKEDEDFAYITNSSFGFCEFLIHKVVENQKNLEEKYSPILYKFILKLDQSFQQLEEWKLERFGPTSLQNNRKKLELFFKNHQDRECKKLNIPDEKDLARMQEWRRKSFKVNDLLEKLGKDEGYILGYYDSKIAGALGKEKHLDLLRKAAKETFDYGKTDEKLLESINKKINNADGNVYVKGDENFDCPNPTILGMKHIQSIEEKEKGEWKLNWMRQNQETNFYTANLGAESYKLILCKIIGDHYKKSEKEGSLFDKVRIAIETVSHIRRIHPFRDGNKRTCAIFLNKLLWDVGLPLCPFDQLRRLSYDSVEESMSKIFDGMETYIKLIEQQPS